MLSETEEMVIKTALIRQDQQKWIDGHEEFNFTGWVRKALDELIAKEKK